MIITNYHLVEVMLAGYSLSLSIMADSKKNNEEKRIIDGVSVRDRRAS
jgi:hypothetical protein